MTLTGTVPTTGGTEDWKGNKEYRAYLQTLPGDQRRQAKKKSRKSGQPFYLGGNTPYTAPTGQGALGTSAVAPKTGGGQPQQATAPGTYQGQIADDVMTAPAGSLASRVAGVAATPDALEMTAINPMLQADMMLGQQYGLPSGSRSAGLLATYLNPQDKALALTGSEPMNNVDWINFGEQLMGSAALSQPGAQLNPRTMVQTLVQGVVNATNAAKAGGGGAGADDQWNRLEDLAMQNPALAVSNFADMVQGALSGTMPADQLSGYIGWLKRVGTQFLTEYVSSGNTAAGMEAAGKNWLTAMVSKLGPSLGL